MAKKTRRMQQASSSQKDTGSNALDEKEVHTKKTNHEKDAIETDESTSKKKSAKSEESFEEQYNALNDKYLRLYSEFDNYRKRTIKEKIELSKTAAEEIITELLPVLDDFERAIKLSEESKNCENTIEGISLIYNKFKGILEKKGVSPIEAVGKTLDTDFHEAVTYIPSPSDELKGKIVDEIQTGYMLNDKVIRYTKVVIGQ